MAKEERVEGLAGTGGYDGLRRPSRAPGQFFDVLNAGWLMDVWMTCESMERWLCIRWEGMHDREKR